MSEMLSDSSEFKELDMKSGKGINSLLQQEDIPSKFLKKIKMSKSEKIKSFILEVHNLMLCVGLLNKARRVFKCPSVLPLFECHMCSRAQVPKVLECPSALSVQVVL